MSTLMKHAIILSVLLLAGTSGAGETRPEGPASGGTVLHDGERLYCRTDDMKGWKLCDVNINDGYTVDAASPCLSQMEAAMRAMEPYIIPFVDPSERRKNESTPYYGGVTLTPSYDQFNCFGGLCTEGFKVYDRRSIEEQLEEKKRELEREQEERGRMLVKDEQERFAYQQWATVKRECWKKP